MNLRWIRVSVIVFLTLVPTRAALAQSCEPRPALHAILVTGEAYGDHDLIVEVTPGLHLALFRALWGWRIAVLDDMSDDLIAAAPVHGRIDPRDIYPRFPRWLPPSAPIW